LPTLLGNLIEREPDGIRGFSGSEYPLPIILALCGKVPEPSQLRTVAEEYSFYYGPHMEMST